MSKAQFQKLIVRLPGGEREVEVAPDGETYLVRTGEGQSRISWEELECGRLLLIADGRPCQARLTRTPDGSFRIEWKGSLFLVRVEDDLAQRARLARAHHGGPLPLRAPMPGTVVKVLVEEGEIVTLEQPVLIIEAMKMQNELAAPLAGTVVNLAVRTGQAVEAEQVLLEIRV